MSGACPVLVPVRHLSHLRATCAPEFHEIREAPFILTSGVRASDVASSYL